MLVSGNAINVSSLGLYETMWRKRIEDEQAEEEEEMPTHINTTKSLQSLLISTDKLLARYTGDGKHGNDVGVVQGNHPAPVRRTLYYFEILIKDRGVKGCISIGFTDENFKTSRQPGWEHNSYGYHGDDGYLYFGVGKHKLFGPTFTTGDTIGAGINYASQEFFFTKNGKLVGTHPKDVKIPLYPSVGLHSPNESIEVNFGQRPFVFDIEALIREEHEKQQTAIENLQLPLSISHSVVRSYLLHYGYRDTLLALDVASGNMAPPAEFIAHENGDKMVDEESYALDHRKKLRQLIRNGDIDSAFAKLQEWYPQLLQDDLPGLNFLLKCQKFIELIKDGFLEVAIKYAQTELSRLFDNKRYEELLQDCIALLAYERPIDSPVGYLLMFGQREAVADVVNSAVLATDPLTASSNGSQQSSLEKLLRQLTACQTEIWTLNGSQGELFKLQNVLRGHGKAVNFCV